MKIVSENNICRYDSCVVVLRLYNKNTVIIQIVRTYRELNQSKPHKLVY